MAEEIIDLRDRIEKMRIQIENEATEQISIEKPLEIHHKSSNSNISLSLQDKINDTNRSSKSDSDSLALNEDQYQSTTNFNKKEKFPSVSLSVKNPASGKVLIWMIIFQIITNFGILYFLYLGME